MHPGDPKPTASPTTLVLQEEERTFELKFIRKGSMHTCFILRSSCFLVPLFKLREYIWNKNHSNARTLKELQMDTHDVKKIIK